MGRARSLRDVGDLPHARPRPCGLQGGHCREARRPVHDPQPHPCGEAGPEEDWWAGKSPWVGFASEQVLRW